MITLIIPTRNRAYTLRKVAPSFFAQDLVSEILFVIDAGTDETEDVVRAIGAAYPAVSLGVIVNPERSGAAHSRNVGVSQAKNELILFCDDDQYLEAGYARVCHEKMQSNGVDIACGRMVHMLVGETVPQAIARFGTGLVDGPLFDEITLDANMTVRFDGDMIGPYGHNAILTRRDLLRQYPFDRYYSKATGWREESDFQMNAYVNGYRLLITNDTHTIHLSYADTTLGGARTSQLYALYCVVRNTRYFYRKFHKSYVARSGRPFSPTVGLLVFTGRQINVRLIRPATVTGRRWLVRSVRRLTGQQRRRTSPGQS